MEMIEIMKEQKKNAEKADKKKRLATKTATRQEDIEEKVEKHFRKKPVYISSSERDISVESKYICMDVEVPVKPDEHDSKIEPETIEISEQKTEKPKSSPNKPVQENLELSPSQAEQLRADMIEIKQTSQRMNVEFSQMSTLMKAMIGWFNTAGGASLGGAGNAGTDERRSDP